MDSVCTDSTIVLADGPTLKPDARGKVFLPIVVNQQVLVSPSEQFFDLLWSDKRQLRKALSICPSLSIAAHQRAQGLANGDPFAHVDKNGITPNEYARAAGCKLPDDYGRKDNGIESIVAGSPNVKAMYDALAASPSHALHLFGLIPQFVKQDKCGIGYAEGPGRYRWYMCILIGECIE